MSRSTSTVLALLLILTLASTASASYCSQTATTCYTGMCPGTNTCQSCVTSANTTYAVCHQTKPTMAGGAVAAIVLAPIIVIAAVVVDVCWCCRLCCFRGWVGQPGAVWRRAAPVVAVRAATVRVAGFLARLKAIVEIGCHGISASAGTGCVRATCLCSATACQLCPACSAAAGHDGTSTVCPAGGAVWRCSAFLRHTTTAALLLLTVWSSTRRKQASKSSLFLELG